MSERPYLSIGEVLELLKGEFPDLSISRIRALESAGQLELERTASGYRKFYEADIAFLRDLLTGHHDSAVRRATASGGPVGASFRPVGGSAAGQGSGQGSGQAAGHGAGHHGAGQDDHPDDTDESPELGPNGELPGDPERRHPAAFQSLRRELSRPTGPTPTPAPGASTSPSHGPESSARVSSGVIDLAAVSDARRSGSSVGSSAPADPAASSPIETVQGEVAVGAADPSAEAAASHRAAAPRNPMAVAGSGISLTLDELVGATGLSLENIRELESLGLLRGQGVFSAVYYDEDALLTCRLVASFRSYGVEPRHLRMYKLAADREASFFEQVVTPQLRRRNPDARESAIETLGELVRLGEQLRVVALRQVLKAAIDR